MSNYAYRQILEQVQQLTPDEQLQLVQDVLAIYQRNVTLPKPVLHNVMEFKGMGKEIWEGIDVQKYIDEERNSWDGSPLHSILELEGLGKEIWEGVDVEAYINQERDSWDKE